MSDPNQDALLSGDFAETRTDDLNAPVDWRGLPEFRPVTRDVRLVLSFDTAEQREEIIERLGLIVSKKTGSAWSAWWPPRAKEDLAALRFDFGAAEQGEPSPDEELADDPDDLEPANAPETAAAAPQASESRPWPEHIGHRIALAFGVDGALIGALCSTCDVELPPPDEEGDSDEPSVEGGMIA